MPEYCDQCGFELFEDEKFCSEYCEALAKHDRDDRQFDAPYKVEPKPLTIS
jgi:predicted nucleic acid-binding Zn ribbon protein